MGNITEQERLLNLYAPQYVDLPNKLEWLRESVKELDECEFGDDYDTAVALLAAHSLTLFQVASPMHSTGARVVSIRAGKQAISFSQAQTLFGEHSWNTTPFGRKLLELRLSVPDIIVCGLGSVSFCR